MNFFYKKHLDVDTYNEMLSLAEFCTKYENINKHIFLEDDINAITELPAYYIASDTDGRLTGFMGVFTPDKHTCEIYCCVHPNYRQKHIFSRLLELFLNTIKNFNIRDIYFIADPGSKSVKIISRHIGAELKASEYMLEFPLDKQTDNNQSFTSIISQNDLGIYISPAYNENNSASACDNEKDIAITITKNSTPIGKCNLFILNSDATIYGFEIFENYRNLGYGKISLQLILNYARSKNMSNVLLHVSGNNKAAYHLYMTNGFSVKEQIDYYLLEIS